MDSGHKRRSSSTGSLAITLTMAVASSSVPTASSTSRPAMPKTARTHKTRACSRERSCGCTRMVRSGRAHRPFPGEALDESIRPATRRFRNSEWRIPRPHLESRWPRCAGRRRRPDPACDIEVRQLTPMELSQFGRVLVLVGAVILFLGLLLVVAERVPLIGRLPGDITVRGDGWTLYAPVATSIVLSVRLTLVLSVVAWGRR